MAVVVGCAVARRHGVGRRTIRRPSPVRGFRRDGVRTLQLAGTGTRGRGAPPRQRPARARARTREDRDRHAQGFSPARLATTRGWSRAATGALGPALCRVAEREPARPRRGAGGPALRARARSDTSRTSSVICCLGGPISTPCGAWVTVVSWREARNEQGDPHRRVQRCARPRAGSNPNRSLRPRPWNA